MRPDMDELEFAQLEKQLRLSASRCKPNAPESLLAFIDTVPTRDRSSRRAGLPLGLSLARRKKPSDSSEPTPPAADLVLAYAPAQRERVRVRGIRPGAVAAGLAAVLILCVSGTALLMSLGPNRGQLPLASAASTQSGAAESPFATFEPGSPPPSLGLESGSPSPSLAPSASALAAGSPTLPPGNIAAPTWTPGGSPSYGPLPTPSRHISGTVTGEATGLPLKGIQAQACSTNGCWDVLTGSDGSYSLFVIEGAFWVTMKDTKGVYASGFFSLSGLTYDQANSTMVDVRSGDVSGIDLALPAAIRLTVKVTDTGGQPVAGVDCELVLNAGQSPDRTDAAGNCSFVLRPGTFYVWFQDPQFRYTSGYYTDSGFSVAAAARRTFTVTETSANFSLEIALPHI